VEEVVEQEQKQPDKKTRKIMTFVTPLSRLNRIHFNHNYNNHNKRVVRVASSSQSTESSMNTEWHSKTVELPPFKRGCHLITRKLVDQIPEVGSMEVGLVNFFIQHTSASLTINENASPDVLLDLADALDQLAPEGNKVKYRHDDEGPDDMPAHIKSSLMGPSLCIPIAHGRLALGTWQGIYLNEHRNYGGSRRILITVQGQRRADGKTYGQSSYR
jgi:secondary thiamine-phosphate synthase enzyme